MPELMSKNARAGAGLTTLLLASTLSTIATDAFAGCVASGSGAVDRLTCGTGFVLEKAPGSELTLVPRPGDAPPRTLELLDGAILIEVEPGTRPTQIRTPNAIAAVRGTTYVVEVTAAQTSVFVIDGEVSVRRVSDAARTVRLRAGQGVDVSDSRFTDALRWPDRRVRALLSRFGR
ncbi:FecR family protein [uncultured Roseobacter sp.]|uniref:FecR family protein n=1 Tax=uncultured Roseobacter sp. TaxID=114847 RepID=UPI0026260741|nr:FecR family protein [uncultured Roseobacter sp.]